MENRTRYIYGLIDPRDQQLRYVGVTVDIKKRLYHHMYPGRHKGDKPQRMNWIRKLRSLGIKPDIFIIEEADATDWVEKEKFWINYFRFIGSDLINVTAGGEGAVGRKINRESMKKFWAAGAKANTGRDRSDVPDEVRKRISKSLKDYYSKHPVSKESKAAQSARLKGRKKSPEHLAKISAALKGKIFDTPERRRATSERMKGKISPSKSIATREKISKKAKEQWARWREENNGRGVRLDYKRD